MKKFKFEQDLQQFSDISFLDKPFKNADRDDLGLQSCYMLQTEMISYTNGDEHSGYTQNTYVISPLTFINTSHKNKKANCMELSKLYTNIIINQARINKSGMKVTFSVPCFHGNKDDLGILISNQKKDTFQVSDEKFLNSISIKSEGTSSRLHEMMQCFVEEAYNYEVQLDSVLKSANQPT